MEDFVKTGLEQKVSFGMGIMALILVAVILGEVWGKMVRTKKRLFN